MTIKIHYNKIIRDKIPQIIRKEGLNFVTRSADYSEIQQLFANKLVEEAKEYQKTLKSDELGDLNEVLMKLMKIHELSTEKLNQIRKEKLQRKGGFDKHIVLEWVEIQ